MNINNFYPLKGYIGEKDFILYLQNSATQSLMVLTPTNGDGLNGPIRLSIRNGQGKTIVDTVDENLF